MNYQKIYDSIINRGKEEQEQKIRKRGNGNYYENHHIIPTCRSGSNDKENLVLLTAREHFICHMLLVEIYLDDKKLKYALYCLMNGINKHNKHRVSSRTYERLKIEWKQLISITNTGRHKTEKEKAILSEKLRGRKKIPRTEEHKKHMSDALKGIGKGKKKPPRTEEHKKHMSEAKIGKKIQPFTIEHKEKISKANTGKIRSDEICKNLSNLRKGKPLKKSRTKEHQDKLNAAHIGKKYKKHIKNI